MRKVFKSSPILNVECGRVFTIQAVSRLIALADSFVCYKTNIEPVNLDICDALDVARCATCAIKQGYTPAVL